mmetsp:Transcript_20984/g.44916  ORF Transcript_20984/g.44916 Transcript_20984/m.44916 type:complete len:99 (-) Transcript_20984:1321-1617(-)
MMNNGGKTKPAIDTQKHPIKLTICTNPEPRNSANSVHTMQKDTLTTILLSNDDCWVLSVPIFPSTSSPNGTTIRGAVTATANVIKRRTTEEIQVSGMA